MNKRAWAGADSKTRQNYKPNSAIPFENKEMNILTSRCCVVLVPLKGPISSRRRHKNC